MDNLPNGWTACDLGSLLISLESGSRPKGGVKDIKEGIPSIGGEHLTYKGTFNFSSVKYVPQEFASRMHRGHIQKNDILIVKDGATTGKTAFVDEKFPFKNAVVNEHVFVCRPSRLVEPRYLFRYLMFQEGQERILDNFQGSARGGINLSFAPNVQVPLAPLPEQHLIVAKLEKLLAKAGACQERLNKIPALLKRFRQSVLAAGWREAHTAPTVDQVESDGLPNLPPSWCWRRIGALFTVETGTTPPK
jgi:type I restriction enzyme S subunit